MKDGKIVVEELKAKMKRFHLDAEKQAVLEKSIDKCGMATGSDECELAASFVKCMHDEEENLKINSN